MFVQRIVQAVTTDADGAATVYIPVDYGLLDSIRYVKTDFADGSTFAISLEATGETIWSESAVNASATRAPRQDTHTTAGAAGSTAAAPIAIGTDRIKIEITNGGDTKTGTFHFLLI